LDQVKTLRLSNKVTTAVKYMLMLFSVPVLFTGAAKVASERTILL